MVIQYDCVPACKTCRDIGDCPKARLAPVNEPVQVRERVWAPNRLPYITLPCGCKDIPWPLVHVFATDIWRIVCDIHGEQTLSKNWKEQTKRKTNKLAKASKQSGQLDILDIPPF